MLFRSQRSDGIDARGPPRRHGAREQRRDDEQADHAEIRHGVESGHAEQHRRDHASRERSADKSDEHAQAGQAQPLPTINERRSFCVAPNAARTPISRVRSVTLPDRTP